MAIRAINVESPATDFAVIGAIATGLLTHAPASPGSLAEPSRTPRAERPGGPAKSARARPRRSKISALLASQIVLGLLVAAGSGLLVLQSREHALTEAEHELGSLSLTLAEQAARAFEEVDLVQTTFMEMARADDVRTPQDFRKLMATEAVYKQLTLHGDTLPQLEIIGIVDTEGGFINVSHTWPVPALSIGDRPYFLALKNDPKR